MEVNNNRKCSIAASIIILLILLINTLSLTARAESLAESLPDDVPYMVMYDTPVENGEKPTGMFTVELQYADGSVETRRGEFLDGKDDVKIFPRHPYQMEETKLHPMDPGKSGWIFIPEGENTRILVLLHGGGDNGNEYMQKEDILKAARETHTILISPHYAAWAFGENGEKISGGIRALLENVQEEFNIDSKNTMIGGLSWGSDTTCRTSTYLEDICQNWLYMSPNFEWANKASDAGHSYVYCGQYERTTSEIFVKKLENGDSVTGTMYIDDYDPASAEVSDAKLGNDSVIIGPILVHNAGHTWDTWIPSIVQVLNTNW